MLKITGKIVGELEIKRFYLEGLDVTAVCPHCDKEIELDQYLSYPDMNIPIDIDFYCNECDSEWSEKAILKVSLEVI